MANGMNGVAVDYCFVNSNKANDTIEQGSELSVAANYVSIAALRGRLFEINPTYYSTVMLNSMTTNDMVFALRNEDDPTSIADYM